MDKHLINTVNRLQDAFAALGTTTNPIDLPQIAVVGSQSSGKSSVLENIVGRDFLPRGSGIVTRRPLILQLTNIAAGSSPLPDGVVLKEDESADEWGEFLHLPGQRFYDFNEIRNEIVRDTEAKTGKNVGISAAPINLRIYSPNVLTLTLIDLPGMTKVPVGDQPPDIEVQIRKMILTYIQRPNSIILSVTAANTDLANSDGLKLAREVDPQGARTIGVLTKIDLMDKGTDVVDILAMRVVKLKYGFVPVINRGQSDINANKSITAALDYERQFFENHPSYQNNAQYCGTPFLARKLNVILMNHIKATLPEIRLKIQSALTKYREELNELGNDATLGSPSNILLTIITELCQEYRTVLDGNSDELTTKEISGGARLAFVFHEAFYNGVNSIDPFEHVKDVDIRTILYNASGSTPSLFVATQGFEVIVKQQILRFEEPSLRCVALAYNELVRIVNEILKKPTYKRYPALREALASESHLFLRTLTEPTNKLVSDMIKMEASYINTAHPDFTSGHKAFSEVAEKYKQKTTPIAHGSSKSKKEVTPELPNSSSKEGFFGSFFGSKSSKRKMAAMDAPPPVLKASGTLSERESMETEVIKSLITSYFDIVKRTTADMVPKAVMLHLVERSKQRLQTELLQKIYQTQNYESLLAESDFVVKRRKEVVTLIETLEKASRIVAEV